ncbi:MAG: ROK family protein [Chloroflexi bacterium]|nr:ROK family protein [Chloroflexota bacterium]
MPQTRPIRTADQALVREINLSLMMKHLREHAPVSRANLAEIIGLNKSTVSSLITELTEHDFVSEIGIDNTGIGRPSRLLTLNPSAGFIVSAQLNVDSISLICTNFAADGLWSTREYFKPQSHQSIVLEQLTALLRQAIQMGQTLQPDNPRLLGLALGLPGLVDQANGTLLFAPNLGWQDVAIAKILTDALGQNIADRLFVENEANMAALGEYFFGAARGFHQTLYLSAIGEGLGGALVSHGQLFRGKSGFAGEFGHMTMDVDGELCRCGNRGCWETQVSQSAIFRYVRQANRPSLLNDALRNDTLTIPMVVEAAQQGDPAALQAWEQVGHKLGIGIAALVNAFNPDLVVLGGILSLGSQFMLPAIDEELHRRALRWTAEATEIRVAKHGVDACEMGGVAMVTQSVLTHPERFLG